jgi:hypothetical protein
MKKLPRQRILIIVNLIIVKLFSKNDRCPDRSCTLSQHHDEKQRPHSPLHQHKAWDLELNSISCPAFLSGAERSREAEQHITPATVTMQQSSSESYSPSQTSPPSPPLPFNARFRSRCIGIARHFPRVAHIVSNVGKCFFHFNFLEI